MRFLRTSAERDADPGSVAVRTNAEGEKESTQVQSQMRHFPIENGNTDMPSGRLPSPRSRPTGSRTALKPADDKARLMMIRRCKMNGRPLEVTASHTYFGIGMNYKLSLAEHISNTDSNAKGPWTLTSKSP